MGWRAPSYSTQTSLSESEHGHRRVRDPGLLSQIFGAYYFFYWDLDQLLFACIPGPWSKILAFYFLMSIPKVVFISVW